jgi:chromosome segregation ATPase
MAVRPRPQKSSPAPCKITSVQRSLARGPSAKARCRRLDQARQQARERELESLQRELGTLRNEIELKLNLKSELAAARTEVEELRQRAPSFKAELEDLREQVAKQKKTISRLRTEHSILEYQQKRLDAEQQKNRQQVSLTVTQMTAFGEQTREILHRLQENGFDLWEMESSAG